MLRTVLLDFAASLCLQEDAMTEVFASNLQTGLTPGRTAARKILARLARQVRFPARRAAATPWRPHLVNALP